MEIEMEGDRLFGVRAGERCVLGVLRVDDTQVHEPQFGPVDVSPEQAERHNASLAAEMLAGVTNLPVGFSTLLYVRRDAVTGKDLVLTWRDTLVSDAPVKGGRRDDFYWSFGLGGGQFVARRDVDSVRVDAECFFFERVS